ncbi:hypothetical protein D3C80_1313910 [compost metagenome]
MDQRRHDGEHERADQRASGINAHGAGTFRAVETVTVGNQRDVWLAVNGIGCSNRFAAHAQQVYRDGECKGDGAEIAEFLDDQCRARCNDCIDLRANCRSEFCNKRHDRNGDHGAGQLDRFWRNKGCGFLENMGVENNAQRKGIKDWQENHRANADWQTLYAD